MESDIEVQDLNNKQFLNLEWLGMHAESIAERIMSTKVALCLNLVQQRYLGTCPCVIHLQRATSLL